MTLSNTLWPKRIRSIYNKKEKQNSITKVEKLLNLHFRSSKQSFTELSTRDLKGLRIDLPCDKLIQPAIDIQDTLSHYKWCTSSDSIQKSI